VIQVPSIEEHDQEIIDRWNQRVKNRSDIVYVLGDFLWRGGDWGMGLLRQLNGRIVLIRGNHDSHIKGRLAKRFEFIKDLYNLDLDGQRMVLTHYPLRTWPGCSGSVWNLHGHSHGRLFAPRGVPQLDVGVDSHDFYPIPYHRVRELVLDRMKPSIWRHLINRVWFTTRDRESD